MPSTSSTAPTVSSTAPAAMQTISARPVRRLILGAAALGSAAILLLPTTSASRSFGAGRTGSGSISVLPTARLSTAARGYWHTAASRIEDTSGRPVRLSGLNWSGFETINAVPGGLEQQDYRAILHTMRANGSNVIRIPFSNQMVESPSVPQHIAFRNTEGAINEDLRDLDSMEILDRVIAAATHEGFKVILDNHRSEAGSSAEESGLWYTERYPESAWIADWVGLAERYRGNSTVIGFDLRNEPHNADRGGACWDCGGANDWHLAAERAGNAVLRVNPSLLLFVEGVDSYHGATTWWGGNLAGARQSPVHFGVAGRLVYSAHVYGPTEYPQPWFNAETTPASLAAQWRRDWAYLAESGVAPVWVGEFGTPNDDADLRSAVPGSEGQWFSALVGFLQAHPAIGWTYWGANGEDRYALLDNQYSATPANASKARMLAGITDVRNSAGAAAAGESPSWTARALLSRPSHRASSQEESGSTSAEITAVPVVSGPARTTVAAEQRMAASAEVGRAWSRASAVVVPPAPPTVHEPGVHPRTAPAVIVEDAVAEQVRRASAAALQSLPGSGQ